MRCFQKAGTLEKMIIEAEAETKEVEDVVEKDVEEQETTQTSQTTETTEKVEEKVEDKGEEKAEYWPSDWREQVAKHASAGNEKAYERELKRLQRVTDPAAIYGNYREAEAKISSNKAIFKPGPKATEEDIKAYHKALGVPDKPEEYIENLQLPHDQSLGEADMEVAKAFSVEMHEAGANQEVMNRALNWYLQRQEDAAAEQDDFDERQRYEAENELKEEYGAAYKRKTAAIASLFATAPGGPDAANEESLYSRLIGGRLADGTLVGNDPDMVRWLTALAGDVNPAATTLPDGMGSTKSVEDEIGEIEKIMRSNKREYFAKHAGRYAELLEVRERMKARG
jgi:hypothetical protein